MKASTSARFRTIWMGMVISCFAVASLSAEKFGLFTYQVIGGTTIQITRYPTTDTAHLDIPTEIDDKPVTSTDLRTRVSDGVIVSDLDPGHNRTAAVSRDTHRRFMRLRFGLAP